MTKMPIQDIPGYTTAFKKVPWETRTSSHYYFHYLKESLAEREIEDIVQTQENAYEKITRFFDSPSYPGEKINYYLYPDAGMKKELMGNAWFAQSVYDDFTVHALYTKEHRVIGPHEDTHLLSLPLGLSIGFLQEGLAEYMVGRSWHGESFEEVVLDARLNANFKFSNDLLISHQAWRNTDDAYAQQYYALAALFTRFLIATYGKDAYLKLYRALTRDASRFENEKKYQEILDTNSAELFVRFSDVKVVAK
ncbi:MAG: hypothetical protein ACYC48_01310 [Minisyncoccota bacterium]